MHLLPPIILPPPARLADLDAATRAATRAHAGSPRGPLYGHAGDAYSPASARGGSAPSPSLDDAAAFLEEAFVLSRSRAVLVSDAHLPLATVLAAMAAAAQTATPDCYTLRRDWPRRRGECGVWVVYGTHEEAAASLALSHPHIAHIAPALESDLEPHAKLARLELSNPPPRPTSSSASSADTPVDMPPHRPRSRFTLSSNPPNAKISYRPGDWICANRACDAYNFARNMACIGCGHPHPYAQHTAPGAPHTPNGFAHAHQHQHQPQHPQHQHQQHQQLAQQQQMHQFPLQGQHPLHHPVPAPYAPAAAPRFAQDDAARVRRAPPPALPPLRFAASLPGSRTGSPTRSPLSAPGLHSPLGARVPLTLNAKPHTPTYPLLTPSGHALSAGGRVRNISTDPTMPCIMYWPDNEPLPERGQIRPSGSQVVQYPPIVNTGNKGAAEKQPGDWICSKCHYLNWRRRKVCQTCYPYAEGNGDSISQAVQAERIALLTNLLNQTESAFPHPLHRRASMPLNTPAPHHAPFPPPPPPRHAAHASLGGHAAFAPGPGPAHAHALRSRSQADLRGLYHDAPAPAPGRPIYQTPAHHASRHSSPARSAAAHSRVPSPTAAFLPACLQDVVSAPSPLHSSPATSASSASLELAFDEFGYDAPRGFGFGFEPFDDAEGDEGESEEEVQFRAPGGATRSGAARKAAAAAAAAAAESIWSLDGEESRTLRPYAPIHAESVNELAARLASLATA